MLCPAFFIEDPAVILLRQLLHYTPAQFLSFFFSLNFKNLFDSILFQQSHNSFDR